MRAVKWLHSYLRVDRYTALTRAITSRNGLEVPINFDFPDYIFLPDDNTGLPKSHRMKYYNEGGIAWPDRYLVYVPDKSFDY